MSARPAGRIGARFALSAAAGLELSLLEVRHAGALFALIDEERDRLRRYLPWVDGTRAVSDTQSYLVANLEQFARSQSLSVGIIADGQIAGMIGYHLIDWPNRRTSIGYWISRRFEGRGLMTGAVKALTQHAFQELGLHRLEIRAATENHRSRGVAERAGYRFEGICRGAEWLHDRYVDHAVYGLIDGDRVG
ncbi:MAG: GNAT family N-acetyltransferase [Myxococcales bacterium]|nr:GNAT family N-acetyltransferase [Myxococcales bacterium]